MSESERKTTSEKKPVVEQKPAVGPKSENFKEAVLRWIHAVNIPMALFVGVVTLAILYFGAIESRVKELVRDPEFVERVAQRARPAIVFDSDGRLLADAGAYKFLEGIPEVKLNVLDETVKSGLKIPYTFTRIIVRPKLPLASAPIVEALDSGDVSVKAQQIAGIAWEIRVEGRFTTITADGGPKVSLAPYRYRLEIIPPRDAP